MQMWFGVTYAFVLCLPGREGSFAHFHDALISLVSWVSPPCRGWFHEPLLGTFSCSDRRRLGTPAIVYSAPRHAVTPELRHTFFFHAVLRHAVFRRVMPRHAMASFRLPALTGVNGTFDGPLSFSYSSEFRPACHALSCHAMASLTASLMANGFFNGSLL